MYTLDKTIPKRKRFSIYKKALGILKKRDAGQIDKLGTGLCLLLPCLLWDLKQYIDDMPNGENWEYRDTPIAFPEIKDYTQIIRNVDVKEKLTKRIEILEEILKTEK